MVSDRRTGGKKDCNPDGNPAAGHMVGGSINGKTALSQKAAVAPGKYEKRALQRHVGLLAWARGHRKRGGRDKGKERVKKEGMGDFKGGRH